MSKLSEGSMLSLNRENPCDRKIMLFDLVTDGHHAGYIQHLIQFFCKHNLSGSLDVVVSPEFVRKHKDVVDLAAKNGQGQVNFVPISDAQEAALWPPTNFFKRKIHYFQQWKLCRAYAKSLKANHCLLMYFDTFQIPLAIDGNLPCSLSAIYFRPTFHYDDFEHYKSTWRNQLPQWQEKFVLSSALRHPQFTTLFSLDPFVLKHCDRLNTNAKIIYLPDPVQTYSESATSSKQLTERLGIDANRKVFLLFGSLDGRKGIKELLEAVQLLSPSLCQQICLLLVGPIASAIESQVKAKIASLSSSLPVQIVTDNQFVADSEIQSYYQLADVILAPYQRHVGMSAILVRAAVAQKPVLSSNYGLMGEITRRYRLGLTVDSTVPEEIAQGLTQFVLESPKQFCDFMQMKSFAEQNTADKFASTIFQNLSN
ncbi:glycosyltransferase [Scytonema sp. UIC 10036]|uniref:glycosyltransferase family 4 protein n=1 Tax=Scytonema sp. UIC 10036 TaxID=2304196 RepID=UPI0012DA1A19|nr:glycosyltransferase [Scytonema sp. UIC 10036]MUG96759.1 glycosyltransferase [Scytonema sp. UIC 10036]